MEKLTLERNLFGYEENQVIKDLGILDEIDNGTIMNRPAPKIAIDYWNLGSDASLRDVVLAVRADEAGHRDKNHDFADKI